MISFADVVSYGVMACGFVAILYGLSAWASHCLWVIRFKGGMARDIRRSVRLGWNTGIPDEGQWVLVRENMPRNGPMIETFGSGRASNHYAVMRRRGEMLWSLSGGYGMPVTNLTGWLAIEDDAQKSEEDA